MRRALLAVSAALLATPAFAGDADFEICDPTQGSTACLQSDFENVVDDISAVLGYKALGPAEATGITGIGVAAIASYSQTEHEQSWKRLTGADVSAVGMAGGVVRKGLPFNIDLGAFYTTVPGASAGLYGAEIRYAPLEGGAATPALAVRAAYSSTTGIDDFEYNASSLDVSMSKGFGPLTPYAGAGYVWAEANPKGTPATFLKDAKSENERLFAGLRIGLGLLDITPEYERIGDHNIYNLLLGLSF